MFVIDLFNGVATRIIISYISFSLLFPYVNKFDTISNDRFLDSKLRIDLANHARLIISGVVARSTISIVLSKFSTAISTTTISLINNYPVIFHIEDNLFREKVHSQQRTKRCNNFFFFSGQIVAK